MEERTTYSLHAIVAQWRALKDMEAANRAREKAHRAKLAEMIQHRGTTIPEIAEAMGVTRAYPHQLAKQYRDGDLVP